MFFKTENYFSRDIIPLARHLITLNGGNETVMVGTVNSEGLVCDVRRAAMGNEYSVPAVISAAKPGEVLIHNHPSGDLRPSTADLDIAARAAEKGIGSYIIDNNVSIVFPVVERIVPESGEVEKIDPDDVVGILGKNGKLKQVFEPFEFRTPQIDMAVEVTEAVNSGLLLAAEAGTGTGKSFAYLIPLLLFVEKNKGRKAVVSTSTIALEEQLYDKDLPFLMQKLNFDEITIAVLKGRSNYLCKRRYTLFRIENIQSTFGQKDNDSAETIREIDLWMNQVNDGSRTTMNRSVGIDIWSEICADELTCEKSKCRYFNSCYFFKARRKANFASLILINHHLLMADVSSKMDTEDSTGILPKFDILVIDEAHNLFKSAISFLGQAVSTHQVTKQLSRLFNPEKKYGLFTKLLDNWVDAESAENLEKAIDALSKFIPVFSYSLVPEIYSSIKEGEENLLELDSIEIRRSFFNELEKLVLHIKEISLHIDPVIKKLENMNKEADFLRTPTDDIIFSLSTDISGTIKKLQSYSDFFVEFCKGDRTDKIVYWGEKYKKSRSLTFSMTPVEIQTILSKHIYDVTPSVIFTSATLATGPGESGFNFFFRESGLDITEREKRTLHLASCFDYSKQIQAFICSDIPCPATEKEEFDQCSISVAEDLVKASNGGALLLFTSIKHKNEASKIIKELDMDIINQGDYPVSTVIKKFRDNTNSTLLATDTFWEGIDMKGDTLRNLVMIRLPFRYPSHPFVKRYVAMLEEKTKQNGFLIYTLPNAILKFKQGVGRLIRTKDDRGTVTILDRRVIRKNYGRDFIKAVPEGIKFEALPARDISDKIKSFFKN
jgi:ATP-dependent DNA helicase DinG